MEALYQQSRDPLSFINAIVGFMPFCQRCGIENNENSSFCSNCGPSGLILGAIWRSKGEDTAVIELILRGLGLVIGMILGAIIGASTF